MCLPAPQGETDTEFNMAANDGREKKGCAIADEEQVFDSFNSMLLFPTPSTGI